MKKVIGIIFILCILIGAWYVHSEIFSAEAQHTDHVTFTIESGESVSGLADRLADEQIIRSPFLFVEYLKWKKLDTKVRAGNFTVEAPITLARIANALNFPADEEREITIIPGWTLREIAAYLVDEGIAASIDDVYALTGYPADVDTHPALLDEFDLPLLADMPNGVSLEGYLRPDTFRVFSDASLHDVLEKLLMARDAEFTETMIADLHADGRTIHEVLTVASLLEKEVQTTADRQIVADLFWRRYDEGWPMQADSSVHYVHGTNGSVFTTKEMRDSLNPYNTYQYKGLPPGPIGTPEIDAIMAAIYPEANDYWYFITTLDTGEVHYAATLDEHNANVYRYLR